MSSRWDEYIAWESKHTEDRDTSSGFLSEVWNSFGQPVLGNKFKDVLEIGIGQSGGVLQFIDAPRKESVDPLFGSVKIKAEDMSFREEFDLVIITNTLTHCDDMGKTVKRSRYALRPYGYLFFMNFLHEQEPHPHHFCFPDQIKLLFKRFHQVSWNYCPPTRRNEYIVAVYQKCPTFRKTEKTLS